MMAAMEEPAMEWRSMEKLPRLDDLVEVRDCDDSVHVAFFDRTGIWWDGDTGEQLSLIAWRPLSSRRR